MVRRRVHAADGADRAGRQGSARPGGSPPRGSATALADTANVVLIGLLVRHRGPLAVALACGGYAVYPARSSRPRAVARAVAEPVLPARGGALSSWPVAPPRRLAWGGACFGFAAAIKIWAFAPALLARDRRRPGPAPWPGGAALGAPAGSRPGWPSRACRSWSRTERVRAHRLRVRAGPVDPRTVRPKGEAGRHHRPDRAGGLTREAYRWRPPSLLPWSSACSSRSRGC